MFLSVTEFIGRFHPLLVHLPIGVLLIGLLLQWLSAKEKYKVSPEVVKIVLLCGAFTAILSCITGFLLSSTDDYDEGLVAWHMWMGIGVAFASLFLSAQILQNKGRIIRRATSFSLFMLVVLTGHLGGSLTHGSDYLVAALRSQSETLTAPKPIANIQEAKVYDDVVQPLLQSKCYSCHGPQKQKGGLRMDNPQLLLKGGKNGEIILSGKGAESEMIKRLLLPREAEHHMPPKEKPQLNERQIALLHWWIDQGAPFTKKVKEVPQPEKIKPLLLALQSSGAKPVAPPTIPAGEVEKGNPNAIAALKALGVVVLPVAQGSNYLMANFVSATGAKDEDLKLLLPLKKQLVWLKLGSTKISDEALPLIAQCTNLTLLHLNNNNISDKNLSALNSLKQLQLLNLTNTRVTSTGLMQLKDLKKLQTIYVFGTAVKPADYPNLKQMFPKTTIDTGGYSLPALSSDTARLK